MGVIKRLRAWNMDRKQADIKKEQNKYGLSDKILEKQIELNIQRNKYDIPDKHHEDDEGYVQ